MTDRRGVRSFAVITVVAMAVAIAACTPASGPILANPTFPRASAPVPTAPPIAVVDPVPIELPRDDGPHERLTEWWYYTGHLRGTTADGGAADDGDGVARRFGFEYVIFRAERGTFPTTWASHLAITDEMGRTFRYAQRLEVGEGVDRSARDAAGVPAGFDLALSGIDPTDPSTFGRAPWTMAGSDGTDHLRATVTGVEATAAGLGSDLGLDLTLDPRKPPVLHDGDGWIDFGPAGGSYYYSRTAMTAAGDLTVDGATYDVEGTAWFDHQWGDFISVGGGGWDWFAVNLDDGTDLTISLVRDADGSYPLVYGTLVDAAGATRHLAADELAVTVTDEWTSSRTGATYPAGWRLEVPGEDLIIDLVPTVADQELDTLATTGVIYWEGSQEVAATRAGRPLGGEGYVELTGYAGQEVAATAP